MDELPANLQAPDPAKRPLPANLQAPDPASRPLPPELEAPDPAKRSSGLPAHATYLGRAKDIPGDIVTAFEEGLNEFRAARKEPGYVGEFLGLLGGATDMALSPATGALQSMFGRPMMQRETEKIKEKVGEPYPGYKMPDQKEAEEASGRELASAAAALIPGLGITPGVRTLGRGALTASRSAARWAFTRPPAPPIRTIGDNLADELHRIRQQGSADRSEIKNTVRAMPAETRSEPVQELLYDVIERNDRDITQLPQDRQDTWAREPQNVLGAARLLAPIRQELSNIYNRLRNLGYPDDVLVNPDYMHRRAVGHTPVIDLPLGQGAPDNPIYGVQRTLPRTTTAMQTRRFMGGFDNAGTRLVVSVDPDTGALAVHSPGAAAPTPAQPHPINPDEFIHNGQTYTLGQTTSLEVERATADEPHPTTYYHNALANSSDALLRMRAVERHVDFLEDLTHRPEWQTIATRNERQARRNGWRESEIPQLRGWYLEPRIRNVFNDFYRPGLLGDNALVDRLRRINNFAISSMFWTQIPHVENVFGHWVVGRGFDWIRPAGVRSLVVDGAQAIYQVTHEGPEYQRLLREGSAMMFSGVQNADFYRNVARLAGMDIMRNPNRWDPIARILGIGPTDLVRALYSGVQRTLWWANDVMLMQRTLELERRMATRTAIYEAEKHFPNYRIPAEVAGSREFSQLLQESAITVFSRYHYGVFRSYFHMLNDAFRGTGPERLEALGNFIALGLYTWVVYPLIDRAVRAITGNPDDAKTRRGPSAVPKMVQDIFDGDESLWRLLGDSITLSMPMHAAGVLFSGGGRDPFTGQPVMQPGADAPEQLVQLGNYSLGQLVQPWQLIGRKSEEQGGRSPWRAATDQALGLKNTSPAAEMGRLKAKKAQRKAAQKRRTHPQGPLEEFFERVYGGGD